MAHFLLEGPGCATTSSTGENYRHSRPTTPAVSARGCGADPAAGVTQAVRLRLSTPAGGGRGGVVLTSAELEVDEASWIVQLVSLPAQVCLQRLLLRFCPDCLKNSPKQWGSTTGLQRLLHGPAPSPLTFPDNRSAWVSFPPSLHHL